MPRVSKEGFINIQTIHTGDVCWWWTRERLHDYDYKNKVNIAVSSAIRAAEQQYNAYHNTTFCCQWEGVQIVGESLDDVVKAASIIAQALSRFKGVKHLG